MGRLFQNLADMRGAYAIQGFTVFVMLQCIFNNTLMLKSVEPVLTVVPQRLWEKYSRGLTVYFMCSIWSNTFFHRKIFLLLLTTV